MQTLYWSVMVIVNVKAKQSKYIHHELCLVTKRMRTWIHAADMSFLQRVPGLSLRLSLRERTRSSASHKGLRVKLLLPYIKRSQLRKFGYMTSKPPGCLLCEVFQSCPTGKRPQVRSRTCCRGDIAWPKCPELDEVVRERAVRSLLTL